MACLSTPLDKGVDKLLIVIHLPPESGYVFAHSLLSLGTTQSEGESEGQTESDHSGETSKEKALTQHPPLLWGLVNQNFWIIRIH